MHLSPRPRRLRAPHLVAALLLAATTPFAAARATASRASESRVSESRASESRVTATPPAQDARDLQPLPDGPVEEPDPGPLPLTELQTRSRVQQYQRAKHWAMGGLVLLSLGPSYHPCAAEILIAALKDRDPHLRAYALAALRRTDPAILRQVLSVELLDELVKDQLRERDDHWQAEVEALLAVAFPDAEAEGRLEWERFWRAAAETYAPEPWVAPELPKGANTVSAGALDRAMDLHEAGLEVCIVIDSTGSMQQTIDTAAAAVDDLVGLLTTLAPDFRLGLVHYRELGELDDGAEVLSDLSKKTDKVRKRLERLQAMGGGDYEERVEKGLALALDPKEMGWRRETNKLVVVVGDAPPHADAIAEAVYLAGEAYRRPFGSEVEAVRATARDGRSRSKLTRPFVTACIGTGPTGVAADTRDSFRSIASAGGGAYAELTGGSDDRPGEAIVARILTLSFGAQYEEQLETFVEVFFTWHRRGLFD